MVGHPVLAVLVPLLALPLVACGTGDSEAAPTTPKEVLAAATSCIDAGNYRFKLTRPGGAGAVGSVHLPSLSAQVSTSNDSPDSVEVRVVSGLRFTKITTTTGASLGWKKEDAAPIDGPDVVGVKPLLAAVVTAEGAAPTVKSTVDLTKLRGGDGVFGFDPLQGLAVGAAVPYVATLDAGGRLTTLELEMPETVAAPGGEWTFEFIAYGAAPPTTEPPAEG